MHATWQTPAPGRPARLIRPRGPWWTRTPASAARALPQANRGARTIATLSGEPGIASVPAPAGIPQDCSPAASRLVAALSRVSCRDASGLAVLMRTGRAGPPGVSRLAAPAAPVARLVRITGPADRHLLPLSRPPSPAWRAGGAGLPAERAPPQAQALPAPGKPGPQADTPHAPGTPLASADSARQHRRLQPAPRAAGQVAAAGRAGLPTALRCRSAWA